MHDVAGRQSNEQAWGSKAEGDDVYENEFIRTALESQARILLVDRTGLLVGPITTIQIDRMVYNPDQSIKGIVVSAGAGTVRWTSGDFACLSDQDADRQRDANRHRVRFVRRF